MRTEAATKEGRLDVILADLSGLSRSQAQRIIKDGEALLNGEAAKPHAPVSAGDQIAWKEPDAETGEKPAPPELAVLHEDDDVLVIDKPAGLLVHQAGPTDNQPTVAAGLVARCPEAAGVGDDPKRPGVVHRLDKDVSGVMILAKTQAAFEHLKRQFQDRSVEKEYLALTYGSLPHDHGEIDLKIARSKTLGRMVARTGEQEGKEAATIYDVIARYRTATYAKVRILTGRTHQIRVHMKAIGHPLVGDKLYKLKQMKNIRPMELGRIFLHAHRLELELPSGERGAFASPLPRELEDVLASLPTA